MRFYGFGNYYLSSLQQGLQAGHAAVDLAMKCYATKRDTNSWDQYRDWAENHKTMVLLNGGNSADLQELFEFLDSEDNPYPYVKFHEDDVSLNGALTYVGTVLPEKIYDTAARLRRERDYFYSVNEEKLLIKTQSIGDSSTHDIIEMSFFEFQLCERLNQYGLAK